MNLGRIVLASLEYWMPNELLTVFLELQHIGSSPSPFELIRIAESPAQDLIFEDGAPGAPNPDELYSADYGSFEGPLSAIIGPNLRCIIVNPRINMDFHANFLDVFLAAPGLEIVDFGTRVGHLTPPSSDITIEDIVATVSNLRYLESLQIPWRESDRFATISSSNSDAEVADPDNMGGNACGHPAHPNLRVLGFPCFYPYEDSRDWHLSLIASSFPDLDMLIIFSAYLDNGEPEEWNSWDDSPLILDYSIERTPVEYYFD